MIAAGHCLWYESFKAFNIVPAFLIHVMSPRTLSILRFHLPCWAVCSLERVRQDEGKSSREFGLEGINSQVVNLFKLV